MNISYFEQGNNKYKNGNYKGAIKDYSQAIRLKPDDASAYNNRGNSKRKQQDYKGAIKDYSQAIKLKPDYADAYLVRGVSKDQLQDYKGAIKDYNQAIKLKPDYTTAYNNRGNIKRKLQDYKGAIKDYNQAITLRPDYADAYLNRGNTKKQLQDYKGAIEDYNQTIKLKPDYATAYLVRGSSKDKLQDYKGAIKDYSQAIKVKPDYTYAYNNRGNTKKNMQDYKGAQSDYLEALRLSPQPSPLFLFNLANLYVDIGQRSKALKRYTEGVKCFQMETEASLKMKFGLSKGNIQHIQSSTQNFEKLKKQANQIKRQAQNQNRTDILQQLTKFGEAIFSASIKATEDKVDQNQTQRILCLYEKKLKQFQKRLGMVQKKVDKLESKVKQMEKRIYTEERVNKMIDKIDSRKLSDFFKILYNMLINHFMAYRMQSTGFFGESMREVATFDKIAGHVCKAQSIVESIPILGDLVGIPFKILNAFRQEKSSRLNSVIADKINGSRLQSESLITFYMSHLIEELINNKPFNARLANAIQNEQKSFLNQAMDVFGQFKEKIYGKVFGGSSREFSYVQQVVTLYMGRFTLQLYEVDSKNFSQHCKNQKTFCTFFMECFQEKAKKQPKIRNNSTKEQVNISSERPLLSDDYGQEEQIQQKNCWQSFCGLFCCC